MENNYIIKKTVKKEKTITVEEEVEMIDWDNVPNGTYMTGKIEGKEVSGVLSKDEDADLFFCQNIKDGNNAPFKFGYKYSWFFKQYHDGELISDVSDIKFPPKPSDLILPPIPPPPFRMKINQYDTVVHADRVEVGCNTISREVVQLVLDKMNEISKAAE